MSLPTDRVLSNPQPKFIERELAADLPNPALGGVMLGDRAFVRSPAPGAYYSTVIDVDTPPYPLVWKAEPAGGGPGAKLQFVVAQQLATPGLDTPMATDNTYPNHEAAYAAAAAAFAALPGPPPFNADFITMPGSYPGFRLRPGMHVSLVVAGGQRPGPIPPDPTQTDSPPFVLTGPVEILAADGWNVVPGVGVPIPNASLSGAVIDAVAAGAAGRCVRVGAGVTAGTVTLPKCVLKVAPNTAAIAIEEVAPGPLNPVALTIQLETSQIEAFGATAFNGVNVRLTGLGGCRIQGALSTSQIEGITLFDSFAVFAPITASVPVAPAGGSTNVRLVRSGLLMIGAPNVTLNGAAIVSFSAGCDVTTFGTAPNFAGTGGTIWLQGGALPGATLAGDTLGFLVNPPALSSATLPGGTPDLNAEGYIAPTGAGPYTYTIPDGAGLDFVPFDFSALAAGVVVTIELPNARLAIPWTPLVLKRIDENLGPIVRIQTTAGNEIDKSPIPVFNIAFPPGDCISMKASREPGSGRGRWLLTP